MSEGDDRLVDRLDRRAATVGICGLGYVGLPLSLEFAEAGFDVIGFDIDGGRVARLESGDSYVDDVTDERLSAGLGAGFEPSDDPARLADVDAFVIAVPTGVTGDGEPDMSAAEAVASTIAEQVTGGETLVVVASTVYPGATREVVAPALEDAAAEPLHLAMVPERLNPGTEYDVGDIPLVVGAEDEEAREAASTLFGAIVSETYPVGSTDTAELTKTLENTYRQVNIALVNELLTLAEHTGADLWGAIEAADTKPFGYQAFYPGPGVGGHCTPVDPQFLAWKAREAGGELTLVEDAHRVNESMPSVVVARLKLALNARGAQLDDAEIVALGATYKPNVADVRNSPAREVATKLAGTADVTVVDPHVEAGKVPEVPVVESVAETDLAAADAVVLLVDHDAFELDAICDRAPFVFDTRNAAPTDRYATVVVLGDRTESTTVPQVTPSEPNY